MCVRLSPLHFSLKLESATADEQAVKRRGAHDQNDRIRDKNKKEKTMITYFTTS
jgi:hypothetical protein